MMRILFDGVDFSSSSGPNSFAQKLAKQFAFMGHTIADPMACDVQLSFICMTTHRAPVVLRLDGIYFNSASDYKALNTPIKNAHRIASAVVVQSEFDRELVEHYIGQHENVHVIRNGTDLDECAAAEPLQSTHLDAFSEVWCCASSWRPHKRLAENARYFFEHASKDACFVIAGENPDVRIADPRVFYAGQLDRLTLLSLFKRSKAFVHLALCDHCPNVVVDARACGCRIVCSSSGGTSEIAGNDAVIIEEDPWDWEPFKLYEPPKMDFGRVSQLVNVDSELDIRAVAQRYLDVLESVVAIKKLRKMMHSIKGKVSIKQYQEHNEQFRSWTVCTDEHAYEALEKNGTITNLCLHENRPSLKRGDIDGDCFSWKAAAEITGCLRDAVEEEIKAFLFCASNREDENPSREMRLRNAFGAYLNGRLK